MNSDSEQWYFSIYTSIGVFLEYFFLENSVLVIEIVKFRKEKISDP